MSNEKIYVGKLTQRENKFGEPETKIWFGPLDWGKLDSIRQEKNDSVNLVIKLSKDGKPYMIVDTWVPNGTASASALRPIGGEDQNLPF